MVIAEQKLRENIAEYILYMYQIQDVIRAYQFDEERIINEFVRPQLPDDSFLPRYRSWYNCLIRDMKSERIQENGHLLSIQEYIIELSYLHTTLLGVMKDEKYQGLLDSARNYVDDFRMKSNLKEKNDVETAFHAMYMKMLLRLQNKEISAETEEAFDAIRILLAYLSKSYHQMKLGEGLFKH